MNYAIASLKTSAAHLMNMHGTHFAHVTQRFPAAQAKLGEPMTIVNVILLSTVAQVKHGKTIPIVHVCLIWIAVLRMGMFTQLTNFAYATQLTTAAQTIIGLRIKPIAHALKLLLVAQETLGEPIPIVYVILMQNAAIKPG